MGRISAFGILKKGRLRDYDKMFFFGGIVVTLIASFMFYSIIGGFFKMIMLVKIISTIIKHFFPRKFRLFRQQSHKLLTNNHKTNKAVHDLLRL